MWIMDAKAGRRTILDALSVVSLKRQKKQDKQEEGSLGRIGSLEVRLAANKKEIRKAQRLRYQVFFREGGAVPDARVAITRRDADHFDKFCDHLIVIDHAAVSAKGKIRPKVVGCYRLLRDVVARKNRGLYSEGEFEVAQLLARHEGKRFLELGRSCVKEQYRNRRTIELLWRGILAYVRLHHIDVLIGCASFPGVNPLAHAATLSFLAHYACAEDPWRVEARKHLSAPMDFLAKDAIDRRKAFNALPPLIKGYLRLGARFSTSAVVDRKFNTTDVFVVMPVADMDVRYLEFFGGNAADRSDAA